MGSLLRIVMPQQCFQLQSNTLGLVLVSSLFEFVPSFSNREKYVSLNPYSTYLLGRFLSMPPPAPLQPSNTNGRLTKLRL